MCPLTTNTHHSDRMDVQFVSKFPLFLFPKNSVLLLLRFIYVEPI